MSSLAGFKRERFIGPEWLRFLLALYLVVYHTLPFYPDYAQYTGIREFTELGFFATSCFFALSGFLLTHVYLDGNRLREPAGSIWAKRFANLYPIHVFTLLFSVSLVTVTGMVDSHVDLQLAYRANEYLERIDPALLEYRMSDGETLVNALLQLTALHAWNPYFLAYNGPLWSVSALFFFYLSFPWVAPRLARARAKGPLLLLLCLASLAPALYVTLTGRYTPGWIGALHHLPLLRWPEFLAGIVAYLLFRDYRLQGLSLGRHQRGLLALLVVAGCGVAAYLNLHGAKHWYLLLHNGLLLPLALVLIVLCATARPPSQAVAIGWAQRLGPASLSIFALHLPMFEAFRRAEMLLAIDVSLCLESAAACVAAARSHELMVVFYPLLLALTVVVCLLFQERIVTPVRQWCLAHPLKRFQTPRPPRRKGPLQRAPRPQPSR